MGMAVTFKELTPLVIDNIDAGNACEITSKPGWGKSEWAKQLCVELSARDGEEWGFAELFLATQTPPDLVGFQFKGTTTWDGREYTITDPTMPTWMMCDSGKPVFAYKRGLLVLDEYGQGQTDVKAASAELLLRKRIGKWALGAGWGVLALSNHFGTRNGVTKSLDFCINRRCEYELKADIKGQVAYMEDDGCLPLTTSFAAQHPEELFADPPKEQGPWLSPRSLVRLDRALRPLAARNNGNVPEGSQFLAQATGWIGETATRSLFTHLRLSQSLPSYEEVKAKPKTTPIPVKPDAAMLMCYNLAHRIVPEDTAAIIQYVERMEKEYAVVFANAAGKRDARLVITPAFIQWCGTNASLMAAVAS